MGLVLDKIFEDSDDPLCALDLCGLFSRVLEKASPWAEKTLNECGFEVKI
jgi:hypothetical protein